VTSERAPSAPTHRQRSTSALTLALAAVVILLDQLSKWWITAVVMQSPRVIPLLPFLNLALTSNRGVSFGMLRFEGAWGPWLLSAFALAVVAWLFLWQRRARDPWIAASAGLIAGGALGNVADRLLRHAVVDFIDVYAGRYHWPAFNLADSAITVGVALLLIESLFGKGGPRKT
jgi:signal peptidase II